MLCAAMLEIPVVGIVAEQRAQTIPGRSSHVCRAGHASWVAT